MWKEIVFAYLKLLSQASIPVGLHGCEKWSLTLRQKHKLRLSENRVLRNIFGPKRDEVAMEGRRLHEEQFYDPYSSPNIIRVIKPRRLSGSEHVTSVGREEVNTGLQCWNLWEREHFEDLGIDGRTILKWKWDEGMCWMDVAQDRDRWRTFVNAVMNLRFP
jgi:hypothetical protein